jgi:alpha-1,3-rhamnosyltransferase
MTDLPLVSVIIPSYNHAQYIETAIESVLNQTYSNLELIIVDDGSKDGSPEIIEKYSGHPRVTTILNEENKGQSAVFNQGLEISKGEFISLLPSDDWYHPHKTAVQIEKFIQSDEETGVVYSFGERFFEDTDEIIPVKNTPYTGWIADKLILKGIFIYPVTPIFRREVFDKVMMNESFRAEGEAIYIRIALHYKFEFVDSIVAVMRDHSYNIGKNTDVMFDEIKNYWDWFFSQPDIPENIQSIKNLAYENLYKIKGMQFIGSERNFLKGRKCLTEAIKINPWLITKPKVISALLISYLPGKLANYIVLLYNNKNKLKK